MKKFSDFGMKRPVRRINEQDETVEPVKSFDPVTGKEIVKEEETPANLPENTEEKEEGCDIVKFFSKLFESREMAHIYHLQVRGDEGSYASHMALGSYYEGVLDLIDQIIEVYQGQYGIVDGYDIIDTKDTKTKDTVAYFEEIAEYIKHGRKCISAEDTHLQNIVDEIVSLVYKTLFKLKFNK